MIPKSLSIPFLTHQLPTLLTCNEAASTDTTSNGAVLPAAGANVVTTATGYSPGIHTNVDASSNVHANADAWLI